MLWIVSVWLEYGFIFDFGVFEFLWILYIVVVGVDEKSCGVLSINVVLLRIFYNNVFYCV